MNTMQETREFLESLGQPGGDLYSLFLMAITLPKTKSATTNAKSHRIGRSKPPRMEDNQPNVTLVIAKSDASNFVGMPLDKKSNKSVLIFRTPFRLNGHEKTAYS